VSRAATRVVTTCTSVLVTTLLTAAPALAGNPIGPSEGADPGHALGLGKALLVYVGTPVGAFLVLGACAYLPGVVKAHRYRPAQGWSADPVWFAGPVDPEAAIAGAELGDVTRGGASGSW
jgi:hypothetical protein